MQNPREDISCQTIFDLIFKYTLHGFTKWPIGKNHYEIKQTEIYCIITKKWNPIWIDIKLIYEIPMGKMIAFETIIIWGFFSILKIMTLNNKQIIDNTLVIHFHNILYIKN